MLSRLKTRDEAFGEKDMLDGNINRIFISGDKKEIQTMYNFAKVRLEQIFLYNLDRIDQKETLQQLEQYQQLEMEIRKKIIIIIKM